MKYIINYYTKESETMETSMDLSLNCDKNVIPQQLPKNQPNIVNQISLLFFFTSLLVCLCHSLQLAK